MRSPLFLLLFPLAVVAGQQPARKTPPPRTKAGAPTAAADTSSDDGTDDAVDDDGAPLGLQFGVASGAIGYHGGRSEQGFGVIARWAPVRWLAMSVTPSVARVSMPASGTTQPATSRFGMTDLPVELSVSHPFTAPLSPTLSVSLGASLPTGDTLSGFGSGGMSWSTSASLGFTPYEGVWANIGAGRSLSGISPQAALMSGSGWGDVSLGTEVTDRLSLSGGYSSDLGAVDPALGRSTSIEGGIAMRVLGKETVHLNLSHGLSGASPAWSVGLAFGTAFPYLNHLGQGSALDQLSQTLGGGSHGLGNGGSGSTGSTHGRGKP